MGFQSGFVAVVGRPNAGKSTLVNRLVGRKVAIVTPRPQTTRNRITGIVNRPAAQIVLLDTPGLVAARSALERQMMDELAQALDGIDLLCLIADATEPFGRGDRRALDRIGGVRAPAFLLLNKIDRMAKPALLPVMDRWRGEHDFAEIIPLSALTGDGLALLERKIIERLPEGPPYFPPEQFTDVPERFLAAELVREKAMVATREEVPHSIAVLVDSFEEGQRLVRIAATIYVEREGHKGIVIGKGGERLKRIGTDARQELEALLGTKVFLELFVKVQPNWRERPEMVRQLDWRRQLEQLGSKNGD